MGITFRKIQGNTWVMDGQETIPVYRLDQTRCILFDTGLPKERKKLEACLEEHGLEPVAIVCTHCHIDHVGSAEYFRNKYQIPLYISQEEGGILSSLLNVKICRPMDTPKELQSGMDMLSHNLNLLPHGTTSLSICGVTLEVIPTSGHSSGHLCFVTPDDVCYLGDAMMGHGMLTSKLPYAIDVGEMIATHQILGKLPYSMYIVAHGGEFSKEELSDLAEGNRTLFLTRASEIKSLLGEGKTIDQLSLALCGYFRLNTHKPKRLLLYQRTIRYFLEYLEDSGQVEVYSDPLHGVCYREKE